MTTTSTATDYVAADEIIARPGRYYRRTRFIMVLVMMGAAPWFAYDGWVKYPEINRQAKKENPLIVEVPNSDFNILLQKAIAVGLPILAIALLAWTLYNSRGQYRLKGNVVSIPGHPDIPFDAIRAIDPALWDRKGIAYLEYQLPTGEMGRARLDDFLYERPPTDEIYDRIKKRLLPEDATPPTTPDA